MHMPTTIEHSYLTPTAAPPVIGRYIERRGKYTTIDRPVLIGDTCPIKHERTCANCGLDFIGYDGINHCLVCEEQQAFYDQAIASKG